jgi:hypothetical protein
VLRQPEATLDALIPAMNYFASWYVGAALAIWFIGFETRVRTIEEIASDLTAPARRQGARGLALRAPARRRRSPAWRSVEALLEKGAAQDLKNSASSLVRDAVPMGEPLVRSYRGPSPPSLSSLWTRGSLVAGPSDRRREYRPRAR